MKGLVLLGSIAIVLGASSMALPVKESSELRFELERTRDVLVELERAYNWRTSPKINSRDVSAVAALLTRLDQETLDHVDKSDRLMNALFQAVKHHSDQSKGPLWLERCNDDCANKVIKEYLEERRTLVSFFEDYKQLSNSFTTYLVDSLLEKPGAKVLSEGLIQTAMEEYDHEISSLSNIGRGNKPISNELSEIDFVAFYKNRQQGRIMGAMMDTFKSIMDTYRFVQNREKFVKIFKEHFLNMLHINGFGVYDYDIIKVDRNLGKFV